MAEDLRIKGQEVKLILSGPAGVEEDLAVVDMEIDPQMEVLSQRYLGEKTERKDDVFNGVGIRARIHMAGPKYLRLVEKIKDRAKRRLPSNTRFNAIGVFTFPDATVERLSVEDIKFASPRINVGGGTDFVEGTIEGEASDFRIL